MTPAMASREGIPMLGKRLSTEDLWHASGLTEILESGLPKSLGAIAVKTYQRVPVLLLDRLCEVNTAPH